MLFSPHQAVVPTGSPFIGGGREVERLGVSAAGLNEYQGEKKTSERTNHDAEYPLVEELIFWARQTEVLA